MKVAIPYYSLKRWALIAAWREAQRNDAFYIRVGKVIVPV